MTLLAFPARGDRVQMSDSERQGVVIAGPRELRTLDFCEILFDDQSLNERPQLIHTSKLKPAGPR